MKNLKLAAFILLSLTLTSTLFAQDKKGELDGQSFTIDVVEKNRITKREDKMKDVISFKAGKITTKFSVDNGFPDAAYTTTSKDALMGTLISFKAESKEKKDTFIWEGVVNGDEIEGMVTRERKGEIRTMYEFTGTLK